ncbi:hypothetical protein BOX15_Mlig025008g1 [Macrostomum lignano]|uniref:Uncharacterized protein n=1 Tax=Macrostomum lignano TaxID=282301 RepID=A0A267H359_9PLAT|nr:hypothetical protein BOX15_Mlig025008g1 [Macrostomum lignano]
MFTKHCRRLLNRRCHCLSKWLRRKRQRREWRQQQLVLPQHSPFHHHQRQMQRQQQQQQRHVACQFEMIPMQDLQNQTKNSKQKLENKTTPEKITVRAESAVTARAAVAALAPSGSSFSSGSARTYEKQQHQQLSLSSSSRRLDRNAFDKMYPPIYDMSPRTS